MDCRFGVLLKLVPCFLVGGVWLEFFFFLVGGLLVGIFGFVSGWPL